jgi:hypothetical protein
MGNEESLVDGQYFVALINNRLVKTRLAYRESVWGVHRQPLHNTLSVMTCKYRTLLKISNHRLRAEMLLIYSHRLVNRGCMKRNW